MNASLERTCVRCGKPFPLRQTTGQVRLYCSRLCRGRQERLRGSASKRRAYWRDHYSTRPVAAACRECGISFALEWRQGPPRGFCSKRCRRMHRTRAMRHHQSMCAECGRDFEGWSAGQKLCSARCSGIARQTTGGERVCVFCCRAYEARGGDQLYFCSSACRHAITARSERLSFARFTVLRYIVARSGQACVICGERVSPGAAELTDSAEELRLRHAECEEEIG